MVLLVLGAIYVKMQEQGLDALFQAKDLYILLGAVLALLFLRLLARRQGRGSK